MKKETPFYLRHFRHIAVLLFLSLFSFLSIQASVTSDQSDVSSAAVRQEQTSGILRAEKINPTTVDVLFSNRQRMTIDFTEKIFSVSFRTIPAVSFVIPRQSRKHRYLSTSPGAKFPD